MIIALGQRAAPGLISALVFGTSLVACNQRDEPSVPDTSQLAAGGPYRMPITVDADQIDGTQALLNFPLLVILDEATTPDIFLRARPDGADLMFTRGDGTTPLESELVSYDATAGQAEIWVRTDQLSKTQNQFYVYYGDPAATSSPGNVWPEYAGVYHCQENPAAGVLRDSGPALVDAATVTGAGSWTSADLVAGQIGKAWYYDGGVATRTKKLCVPGMTYTISGWVKLFERSTDMFIQTNPCFWHLAVQSSDVSWSPHYQTAYCGRLDMRWMPQQVVLNEWHHWLWIFDESDSSISLFYDGEPKPVTSIYPGPPEGLAKWPPHPINPGATEWVGIFGPYYANGWDEMGGTGDEFRVRPGVLSPEWIRTEYRNQKAPLAFLEFGQEEQVP